jgi:hypothetical protein
MVIKITFRNTGGPSAPRPTRPPHNPQDEPFLHNDEDLQWLLHSRNEQNDYNQFQLPANPSGSQLADYTNWRTQSANRAGGQFEAAQAGSGILL